MNSQEHGRARYVRGSRVVERGNGGASIVLFFGVGFLAVVAALVQTRGPGPTVTIVGGDSDQAPEATLRTSADSYWSDVSDFGIYNYQYSNLADLVQDSHLVVRGRLVGAAKGYIESFEKNPLHDGLEVTFGVVQVNQVLKGVPSSPSTGTILVARLALPSSSQEDFPKEDVILFLKNYAQMRLDEGVEAASTKDDRFYYTRPNGYQGLLRIVDERIAVIDGPEGWKEAFGTFPSDLDGVSAADLARDITTSAEE